MSRPVFRLRPDGNECVVLMDLFETDGSTAIPVGVGLTPAEAVIDAQETLLVALGLLQLVVEDFRAAREWPEP
jgi:hypothetical protein